MKRIQSKKHKLGTSEINKKSLSCFDDKRFVLNDGIHTIAYFHRELKKQILKDDINKKRFSQTKRILKDSHKRKRFSEMITNKNECVQINFPQAGLTGVHVSSIVFEVIKTISTFFHEKILSAQKRKSN